MTVSRVMPVRIDEAADGVAILPSRMTNKFSPAPSLTVPSVDSAMPSANPRRFASVLISVLER